MNVDMVYPPDHFDPSGFSGTWGMLLSESTIWDAATQAYIPEVLAGQEVTIRHEDDLQIYRIRVDITSELRVHMAYECRFGAHEWTPYRVVEIDGDPEDSHLLPNDTLRQGMRLGEPIAWVKQVYVDPHTQYRITRNPDGTAQYVMMRRLNEDLTRNVATVLHPDGIAHVDKVFARIG